MAQSNGGVGRARLAAAVLGAVALIVVALPSTAASFMACIGSEGAGVEANSLRGIVCDTPAGPWPYVLGAALLGTALAVRRIRRSGDDDAALLWAGLPALLVLLVPVVLGILPRT